MELRAWSTRLQRRIAVGGYAGRCVSLRDATRLPHSGAL